MKLLQDHFFITADADLHSTLPIVGLNGERLVLDKRFDPYLHATRFGTIAEVPASFSPKSIDSNIIKKGDTVWFHHFVCQDKNKWLIKGEEFFQAHFEQIWAKVENDQLIPINDWLFLSPIPETEESMYSGNMQTKEYPGHEKAVGICFAVSEHGKSMGLNPGDKVHILKDADYALTIGDKTLWRIRIPQVLFIEQDGEFIPLADKVIIKEDALSETVMMGDIMVPISYRSKDMHGTVLNAGKNVPMVKKGDNVCFLHGVFTRHEINQQLYAVIRKENLIYKK